MAKYKVGQEFTDNEFFDHHRIIAVAPYLDWRQEQIYFVECTDSFSADIEYMTFSEEQIDICKI